MGSSTPKAARVDGGSCSAKKPRKTPLGAPQVDTPSTRALRSFEKWISDLAHRRRLGPLLRRRTREVGVRVAHPLDSSSGWHHNWGHPHLPTTNASAHIYPTLHTPHVRVARSGLVKATAAGRRPLAHPMARGRVGTGQRHVRSGHMRAADSHTRHLWERHVGVVRDGTTPRSWRPPSEAPGGTHPPLE